MILPLIQMQIFWVPRSALSLSRVNTKENGCLSCVLMVARLASWNYGWVGVERILLGLQRRLVLTQSLGGYQRRLEGQPNASSAVVTELSSPVAFPDGKYSELLTMPQRIDWIWYRETRASKQLSPKELSCLLASPAAHVCSQHVIRTCQTHKTLLILYSESA